MRLNLTHIGIAGLVVCVVMTALSGTGDAKSPVLDQPKTYTVQSGDTLWSIVMDHHQYDNEDPRDVIYQIETVNGMKNSVIQEGQAIQLP